MTEILEVATQGPPGPPGIDGAAALGSYVASENVPQGMPMYVSRSTGQVGAADAGVYVKSFVLGCAVLAAVTGFPVQLTKGKVELNDWTAVAGQAHLTPGLPYFLKPGGGITASVPAGPVSKSSTVVGVAMSATALMVEPNPPLLL